LQTVPFSLVSNCWNDFCKQSRTWCKIVPISTKRVTEYQARKRRRSNSALSIKSQSKRPT